MSERGFGSMRGATLAEVLAALAIFLLLVGLIHVGVGVVREQARQTQCISNLRQISQAISMYRQDYGGQEPSGAMTAAQLGLPTVPFVLRPYVKSQSIFTCPNDHEGQETARRLHLPSSYSYIWSIQPERRSDFPVPKFSTRVGRRGTDVVLVADDHHDSRPRIHQHRSMTVIVLRLDGQAQKLTVPGDAPTWAW